MKAKNIYTLVLMLGAAYMLQARDIEKEYLKSTKSAMNAMAEGCAAATSTADLNINNVRARILGSGDMWWDLNDAKYEVPKGSNKHSMFAGALWLGGYDEADQLRLAAMTYRQRGVDYWPGPLSNDNTASVTATTCQRYNHHWVVYREDVELHAAWVKCKANPQKCNAGERFPGYGSSATVPTDIREWPGNGIDQELPNKLAPYFETDGGDPGTYEWEFDYPGYDIDGDQNCALKEVDLLYGDQTIWWVYNDKGNIHTETQAASLGFEIRAQAFAFTSSDEVNNMTFNNYRILNKSTFRLTETYFGTWFDPDLGNSDDDIIGCDIARGLGYCYNSDNFDEGANGYGENPPAVGFDFFQGPFADYFDGVDNDRDGCVDGVRNDTTGVCETENLATGLNERIIMSGFMYYNRSGSGSVPSQTTDPSNAKEFYNLLTSRWKGGNNLIIESPNGKGSVTNGDGYVASNAGTKTLFAYPGRSFDTTGAYEPSAELANGGWWESPTNNADKRGLHCAGPFSLAPGALNFITTGVVWARNFSGNDLFASVNDVIIADDKAQQLFDNCFDILDGPTTPDLKIVELDQTLILKLENVFTPQTIGYEETDPAIPLPDSLNGELFNIAKAREIGYNTYRFEGFQIFQVAGPDVSVEDIYDRSQSRLIWQSDLKNDIGQLINYEVDQELQNNALVPVDKTLQANNDGIELTFRMTEDAFAEGNKRLVNNKEYYFYVIAYAQNQFIITDPRDLGANSQKKPYLAGRKNIGLNAKPYLGSPNKINSSRANAQYGEGLPITRFAGAGNSGNFERLTPESRMAVATGGKINELHYEEGAGPLDVKVVDPLKLVGGDFTIEFNGVDNSSGWRLDYVNADDGKAIDTSNFGIGFLGEQIIDSLGISIALRNPLPPGFDSLRLRDNGLIGGEITYAIPSNDWLSGVSDDDTYSPTNWILAGNAYVADGLAAAYNERGGSKAISEDPFGVYETILNGTWAPIVLTSDVTFSESTTSPAPGYGIRPQPLTSKPQPLAKTPNIDVVITSDKNLWTRVPVFELGNIRENNEYNKRRFELRGDPTMDIVGEKLVPRAPGGANATGWSYFPGYAINVETGRRLHMAFGENSWLKSENGGDMIWNPTAGIFRKLGDYGLGGMHIIYVFADSVAFVGNQYIDLTYDPAVGDDINQHPFIDKFNVLSTSLNFTAGQIFSAMSWAGFPLAKNEGFEFQTYDQIPSDVTVKLRVDRPYQRTDPTGAPNDGFPKYNFSTLGLQPATDDVQAISSALDLIKVVPNPYNGSSEYEDSQLDNIVKITNLPNRCTIKIFMTNGTLVRTIDKDNSITFVEWDLKNDFNVPIASGIYLIHIDAGEAGQKVVKWIGSLRPIDLNAF